VAAAGPVGYWRLGQTGGIVAPSAVGGAETSGYYVQLDGTDGPGSLAQSGPRSVDGFYGMGAENRAPHFDGDTSYVSIPDSATFDQTGAITMEAWIKLDEYPEANGGIVAKYLGEGNQRGYEMYVNIQNGGEGELGMVISADGTFATAANLIDDQPLPLGEWLHVASVFAPDQFLRLYIDGELVAEMVEGGGVNIPSTAFSNSAELWIGRQFSSSSTFHFPGLIDEVALYDRALTADEIQLHYLGATQLPGDFNRDGTVDAADYALWRNSLGFEVSPLTAADADGDGMVTALDYQIWKAHFGLTQNEGSLAAAQVPEPATLSLLAALLALAAVARRQH
jgi:hyaluronoglucosaminidase